MPERFDDLGVPMDPATHERMRTLLLARLEAATVARPRAGDDQAALVPVAVPAPVNRRLRRVLAVAAVLVVLVVGLVIVTRHGRGTGPIGPSPTTTTTAAPGVAALGPLDRATGTAVTVGFVTDGVTSAGGGAGEVAAAQAATRYVNEHLGGLAGHPVTLEVCNTNNSADGATTCASQLVAKNAVAVLENRNLQGPLLEANLNKANVPYLTYDSAAGEGYSSNMLTNTIGATAAPLKVALDQKLTRVAVVSIDVNLAGGIRSLIEPWYRTAGITADFVAIRSDATDVDAQLRPVLAKDPQQIVLYVDTPLCAKTLTALRTERYAGSIFVGGFCVDPTVTDQVPGGLVGTKLATNQSTDPGDSEVALYHDVMAAYAAGTDPDGVFTAGGYAAVLALRRGLNALAGDVTPSSVHDALRAMSPQPMPLASKSTFQCSGTVVLGYSGLCSKDVIVTTLDAQGRAKDEQLVDVTGIVKP